MSEESIESHILRRKAIARYMMLKGINVGNGNYDVMIETWDDALSRYRDEDLVDMCKVAAEEPGRVTLHEFLKATDDFMTNRWRMRSQ